MMERKGKDFVKERYLICIKILILLLNHFGSPCSVNRGFYFLVSEISTHSLMKVTPKYNHFTFSIIVKATILYYNILF